MRTSSLDLAYELTTRYAMFARPLTGNRNVVMDSFMPKYFMNLLTGNNITNEEGFPKTAVAISELTSDLMNVPLMPRDELFRLVGYSEKDLKTLLRTVASKKLHMTMVGLGGTGANTLYWLYEMSVLCNVPNIFHNITVFEPDSLEFHNMLRMPMSGMRAFNSYRTNELDKAISYEPKIDIVAKLLGRFHSNPSRDTSFSISEENFGERNSSEQLVKYGIFKEPLPAKILLLNPTINRNPSKLHLLDLKYRRLSSTIIEEFRKRLGPKELNYSYYSMIKGRYVTLKRFGNNDHFLYGAPDITTREGLKEAGIPLITATHGNDDASLSLNPVQNSLLQVESYGMIRLTTFFLNQIRLAIGLLEYLASDFDLSESKQLLDYSYPRDAKPLPTKRQWSLQLEHSGLMEDTPL